MDLEFSCLKPEEIPIVVSLHITNLGNTLNAKLGRNHLSFLYLKMIEDPDSTVYIVKKKGKIIGAASATLNSNNLKAYIRREYPKKLLPEIIFKNLIRFDLLLKYFQFRRTEKAVLFNKKRIYPTLTTILIDENTTGGGVGKSLILKVEDFFSRRGVDSYKLAIQKKNKNAWGFYMNSGFKMAEQQTRHSFLLIKKIQHNKSI